MREIIKTTTGRAPSRHPARTRGARRALHGAATLGALLLALATLTQPATAKPAGTGDLAGKADGVRSRQGSGDPAWKADGVGVRSQPGTAGQAVNPEMIPDGAGGAIVTWADFRSATRWNIYAQRIGAGGGALWKTDGVLIRGGPGTPSNGFNSRITTDGAGGAIIAWQDSRAGKWDIYAQRVSGSGKTLWASDGMPVRALPGTAGDAQYPRLIPDGAGGAILTWHDGRSGGNDGIYAQRIDANGNPWWSADGIPVRARPGTAGDAQYTEMVSDGQYGAIIAWRDRRSGRKWDVYAQRVSATGALQWKADGVGVRSGSASRGDSINHRVSPDGAGGAIVTWQDFRSMEGYDVYAQRIGPSGRALWEADGIRVRGTESPGSYAVSPDIVTDGAGGAIVTWQDFRSEAHWETFAQRLDRDGNALWRLGGLNVGAHSGTAADAKAPRVAPDASGGALFTWRDNRSGGKWDIYAQGVDAGGKRLRACDGIPVRARARSRNDAANQQVAACADGGSVIVWMDNRAGDDKWDIYAQKVPPAACSFYFAEGYTGEGFQEYLCIGNPGPRAATAEVTFLFNDGTVKEESYGIPARSRYTVDVNAVVGEGREVSIAVRSPAADLVAERPMYFNYKGKWNGGSTAVGAKYPARDWYFAEGTTLEGFDQYVTVMNTGPSAAELTFRYMVEGEGPRVLTGRVQAASRATFVTRDQVGGMKNVSLHLESNLPVVAERPVYFSYRGLASGGWTGGHNVLGANRPSCTWYFSEGTTRAGFEEWLCLQNPGTSEITVNASYQLGPGQGEPIAKSYRVPPAQRVTVSVNRELGPGKDCSVFLTGDSEFIAERPVYFLYKGEWDGGHDVLGATGPAVTWSFAEGCTAGGFEEWLCLQNPGPATAHIGVTWYTASGVPLQKELALAPFSRLTVDVNREAGSGLEISTVATSDRPIIVERPMYFDYRSRTGGHDVLGY